MAASLWTSMADEHVKKESGISAYPVPQTRLANRSVPTEQNAAGKLSLRTTASCTLELNWGCLHRITCPTVPAGFDSGYLDFYQCYPNFCDFAVASTYCFALHMASDYRTLRNQRIKTASMCGRVDEIEWPLHIDQSSHQFFPEAISVFTYHVLISGTEDFHSLG